MVRQNVFIALLAVCALVVVRLVPLPPLVIGEESALSHLPTIRAQVANRAEDFNQAAARYDQESARFEAAPPDSPLSASRAYIDAFVDYATAADAYFDSLREYEDTMMAISRALGPRSEPLRPATWPFVEYLKLYPEPVGLEPALPFAPDLRLGPAAQRLTQTLEPTSQTDLPPEASEIVRVAALHSGYAEALAGYDRALSAELARPVDASTPLPFPLAIAISAAMAIIVVAGIILVVGRSPNQRTVQRVAGGSDVSTTPSLSDVSAGSSAPAWRNSLLSWLRRNDSWAFGASMFVAFGIAYLTPKPLMWLGIAAFIVLAALRPGLALVFAVGSLPLYFRPRSLGPIGFAPTELALAGAAIGWLGVVGREIVTPATTRRSLANLASNAVRAFADLFRGAFTLPLILFLVIATASLAIPDRDHVAFAIREYRTTIAMPILLYLLVVGLVRTKSDAFRLIDAVIIVSAALVARIGIDQFLFGADTGVWQMEGVGRILSVYPSATALGFFLGRVMPLAIALALFGRSTRRQIGYALLSLPIALAIGLTFSRGAWVGVLAGLGVIALLTRARRLVIPVTLVGAAGLALLPFARVERLQTFFDLSAGTNISRLELWSAAIRIIRDHPLLGIGLDQFLYLDAEHYGIPQLRFFRMSHPHDVFLSVWVRLGTLGFLAFAWLIVGGVRLAWRLYRHAGDPRVAALMLGLIGSFVDFLVHGLVDEAYFNLDMAGLFWLTLGLLEVLRRTELAKPEDSQP